MPKRPAGNRKKFFVDREVQGGILLRITFHWFALMACSTLMLMVWLRLFEAPDTTWAETCNECVRRFVPFFIVSLALVPAFAWDTVKFTNRFAGPLSRLRDALADASEGHAVKPLEFRVGDYWHDIAKNFNSLAARYSHNDSETSGSTATAQTSDQPIDHADEGVISETEELAATK